MTRYANSAVRLEGLAKDDPDRRSALADRAARAGKRAVYKTCAGCGRDGYSVRAKADICDDCLGDIWSAIDARVAKLSAPKGLKAYVANAPGRYHDFPYPALPSIEYVPAGAVFATDNRDRTEAAAHSMQNLFGALFAAFAKVYPIPDTKLSQATPFLGRVGSLFYAGAAHGALLPPDAVRLLEALWCFICWSTHSAYAEGFNEGTNILARLDNGTLTQAGLESEVHKGLERARKYQLRAAAGEFGSQT